MKTVRDMLKKELRTAVFARDTYNRSAYAESKERIRVLIKHRHNKSFDFDKVAQPEVKRPTFA